MMEYFIGLLCVTIIGALLSVYKGFLDAVVFIFFGVYVVSLWEKIRK